MQHTVLCTKRHLPNVIPSLHNSSKIIQSTYAMNPDVYRVSSQDFVDSIATNLYAAYFQMCSCKPSKVCNIQYCGHFNSVEMVLFQMSQYLLIV